MSRRFALQSAPGFSLSLSQYNKRTKGTAHARRPKRQQHAQTPSRPRARRVCGRRRHGGRRPRHRALAHALPPGGPDLRGKPLRGPRLRLLVDARRTIHRGPSARRLLRRGRHRGDQSRGARPGLARRLPDGHGHDDRQPRRRAARQLPRVVALVARHLRRRGLCGAPPHSGAQALDAPCAHPAQQGLQGPVPLSRTPDALARARRHRPRQRRLLPATATSIPSWRRSRACPPRS